MSRVVILRIFVLNPNKWFELNSKSDMRTNSDAEQMSVRDAVSSQANLTKHSAGDDSLTFRNGDMNNMRIC